MWTRAGKDTTTTTDGRKTIHHFFWGLRTAVWNDEGDCAVLFDVNAWQSFRAK